MISWRGFRADLGNLSNRFLFYPVMYSIGFAGYWFGLSTPTFSTTNFAIPLLAINIVVFAHIASEKIDRVSDRICLELGGHRRRIATRMCSVAFWNLLLISAGELWALQYGSPSQVELAAIAATSLTVIAVASTLGVLIADILPHPILAMAATFVIIASTGTSTASNFNTANVLGMIQSDSLGEWLSHCLMFLTSWGVAALFLSLLSKLITKGRSRRREGITRLVKPPNWVAGDQSLVRLAFRATFSDPLPLVSLLAVTVFYSYGTVLVAADLASFQNSDNLFGTIPSLIFMNVIPAILLSSIWHRQEVADQESLLYRSQAHALLARVIQYSSLIAAMQIILIFFTASLFGMPPSEPVVIRSLIAATLSAPALSAIGLLLARKLRLPLLVGAVSYLLTLPEVVGYLWFSDFSSVFPTTLYSGLIGALGPFQASDTVTPLPLAILFLFGLYLPLALTMRLAIADRSKAMGKRTEKLSAASESLN